jgi:hypothetical protein
MSAGSPSAAVRRKPSPAELGTTGLAPLADAPGTYVFKS